MSKTEQVKELSIRELLNPNYKYIIPIYQRNYAWTEKEIEQLILDIVDLQKEGNSKNYYLGTLVVDDRGNNIYEVIDGQQRLTTLALLIAYLKNISQVEDLKEIELLNLTFDSRKISKNTLEKIYSVEEKLGISSLAAPNSAMVDAYKLIDKHLPKDEGSIKELSKYILKYIKIMRVKVPENTDLNHYFEIMNSRGEQLEKHEVLKAKLMDKLDLKDHECFNRIWEACSNMERYIQTSFNINMRNTLFTENNWNLPSFSMNFQSGNDNFNLFPQCLVAQAQEEKQENELDSTQTPEEKQEKILNSILAHDYTKNDKNQQKDQEEAPERFNTIINFPNFLLHVLQIQKPTEEISLDDKSLIKSFEKHILTETDAEEVKQDIKTFAYTLLKCKFLYDTYIIKREFKSGSEKWSLKKYQCEKAPFSGKYKNSFGKDDEDSNGNNADTKSNDATKFQKPILMLQAAFHVSTPTLSYKYWLNGALCYLFTISECGNEIEAQDYLNYLENLAKRFVFDRFLSPTNEKKEYHDMIYNQNDCKNKRIDESKLKFGAIENNFVFNYLDYLLWKESKNENLMKYLPNEESKDKKFFADAKIKNFEYTFRSSVEHYYPQNPGGNNEQLLPGYVNCFGNLCLISHSKNSKLSNRTPKGKKEDYTGKAKIDSIKQHIMMSYKNWNEENMEDHYEKMLKCLESVLGNEDTTSAQHPPEVGDSSTQSQTNEHG